MWNEYNHNDLMLVNTKIERRNTLIYYQYSWRYNFFIYYMTRSWECDGWAVIPPDVNYISTHHVTFDLLMMMRSGQHIATCVNICKHFEHNLVIHMFTVREVSSLRLNITCNWRVNTIVRTVLLIDNSTIISWRIRAYQQRKLSYCYSQLNIL